MADRLRAVVEAYGALRPQQRLAVWAAVGLFVTMFLPWYTKSAVGVAGGRPVKAEDALNAFQAFSFVEAAVLLVAAGVVWMMLARGADKGFHLPGGDGTVVIAAGVWVCLLVFYRQLDKPDPDAVAGLAQTVGVSWGIFVTFLCGLALAAAGNALRAAHVSEPPLPATAATSPARPRRPEAAARSAEARRRMPPDEAPTVVSPRRARGSEQLSFDDEG